MAKDPRLPFEEDSAEDSVATNTTQDSDEREEYDVEKILAERRGSNGEPEYLVKWLGYVVSRASWEPRENFNNDHFFGLWKEEKGLIRAGNAKAFDVDAWQAAQDREAEAKYEKHQRRKAKRRKRGEIVSSDDESSEESEDKQPIVASAARKKRRQVASDSEDDRPTPAQTQRKKSVASAPPQRKRIARRSEQQRRADRTFVQQDDGDTSDDDMTSLFGSSPVSKKVATAPMVRPQPAVAKAGAQPPKPVARSTVQEAAVRKTQKIAAQKPTVQRSEASTASSSNAAASRQPVARKSAPATTETTHKAKPRPANVFANWDKPKKRRERVHVSGETPKDSTDPKFTKLSIQNRYQKFSVNEPAPNIEALTIVDPKTGKAQPPKLAVNTAPSDVRRVPGEIHSAYGRRDSPPAQRRSRSRTPPSPRRASLPSATVAPQDRATVPQQPPLPQQQGGWAPRKTCWNWIQGSCPRSERDCWFAHYKIPEEEAPNPRPPQARPPPFPRFDKKSLTCHFFLLPEGCKKPAEECEFSHYDTGTYTDRSIKQGIVPNRRRSHGAPQLTESHMLGLQSPSVTSALHSPLANSDPASATADAAIIPDPASATMPRNPPRLSFEMRLEVVYRKQINPTVAPAMLEMTKTAGFEEAFKPGNYFKFAVKHMVKATDLRNHLQLGQVMHSSSVGSITPRHDSRKTFESLARMCDSNAAAFVSVTSAAVMTIISPCKSKFWEFLDEPDIRSDAVFNFRMLQSPFDLRMLDEIGRPPVPPADDSLDATIKQAIVHLDTTTLSLADTKAIFMFASSSEQAEFAILATHLEGLGCKVFNNATLETWASFRRDYAKSCLIVVHARFPVWEMRGLHRLLAERKASVKVVEVTFPEPLSALSNATLRPQCRPVFPHGMVIFITDEVFVHHPDQANDIIQWFLKETAPKPLGAETSKIATRPGIKKFLYDLAVQHANERGRQDFRWINLYTSICALCPLEAEDPTNPPNPLPTSHLVSEPPEHMPSMLGLWERDEAKATDLQVEWFAGWSAVNAHSFRRFFVCYEARGASFVVNADMDPRGWTKKWHHIGVETPDALLKRLKSKK